MNNEQSPVPKFKIGDKIAYNSEGMEQFEPCVASFFWRVKDITPKGYILSSMNMVSEEVIHVPLMVDFIDAYFTLFDSPESVWLRL